MNMEQNAMDWNDTLESDGAEFVVLPEGDYTFSVTHFERGHYAGGDKLPACNKATLTLRIDNDQGVATARFDLLLHRSLEWKIASFFRAIGQKKQGEKIIMDWSKVEGARGRAHFRPRTYKARDGQERQRNEVERFYDYDPSAFLLEVKDEDLPWGNGGE